MRKLFPLVVAGQEAPRVVDSIKNEVRKYLKRERRKPLPNGVDYWDFDCRTGRDRESPSPTHVAELITAIDTASAQSWSNVYVEILAKPGHRQRPAGNEPVQAAAPAPRQPARAEARAPNGARTAAPKGARTAAPKGARRDRVMARAARAPSRGGDR
jgi:hypothetical protein